MRTAILLALVAVALVLLPPPACADEGDAAPEGARLVVGTRLAPPFVTRDEEGDWQGISIELWHRIAAKLGLETEFREASLADLLEGVERGTFDAGISAITVTSEREERADFTHAFYTTGLGIAARNQEEAGLGAILARVVSTRFLKTILVLVAVLAGAGFLLWFFERRRNVEQFGGGAMKGFGNAFWWSAVTMTTVGYGDKAPVTWPGRLVAIIWMFTSILVIASITASIASALTVSRLEGSLHGPEDLPGLEAGTVRNSTSDTYLAKHGIRRRWFGSTEDALDALARREVDAVVYDHPLLVYLVAKDPARRRALTVLPRTFGRQDYAIALPPGSEWRERVNRELLNQIASPEWDDLVQRHLNP